MIKWFMGFFSPSARYIYNCIQLKKGGFLKGDLLADLANLQLHYEEELDFLEVYEKKERNNSASFLFGVIKNAQFVEIQTPKGGKDTKTGMQSYKSISV